jgi:hypothetical protein
MQSHLRLCVVWNDSISIPAVRARSMPFRSRSWAPSCKAIIAVPQGLNAKIAELNSVFRFFPESRFEA